VIEATLVSSPTSPAALLSVFAAGALLTATAAHWVLSGAARAASEAVGDFGRVRAAATGHHRGGAPSLH
jgi:hypothetical protein